MIPDNSSDSVEAGHPPVQPWPLPENEVVDAEAVLTHIQLMIAQIEQTIDQAKLHLATLDTDAPFLRQVLVSAEAEHDVPRLADLQAARGLRAELVKAAQQTVTASQSAARYLQARERFLLARRDWIKRSAK